MKIHILFEFFVQVIFFRFKFSLFAVWILIKAQVDKELSSRKLVCNTFYTLDSFFRLFYIIVVNVLTNGTNSKQMTVMNSEVEKKIVYLS